MPSNNIKWRVILRVRKELAGEFVNDYATRLDVHKNELGEMRKALTLPFRVVQIKTCRASLEVSRVC